MNTKFKKKPWVIAAFLCNFKDCKDKITNTAPYLKKYLTLHRHGMVKEQLY